MILRLAIFALLWPPIGFFTGATLTEGKGDVSAGLHMTWWLLPLAYLFLTVPALGLGWLDWRLSGHTLRLFIVGAVSFVRRRRVTIA